MTFYCFPEMSTLCPDTPDYKKNRLFVTCLSSSLTFFTDWFPDYASKFYLISLLMFTTLVGIKCIIMYI